MIIRFFINLCQFIYKREMKKRYIFLTLTLCFFGVTNTYSCTPTSSTDTIISCGPYTWTNGVTYTVNNNTATDTFVNAAGCDSIITLNLTFTEHQQQGSDIDGEARDDYSGVSVSLSSDGSTVAIGALQNDGNGSDAGHVRIYKNISGTWTQVGADIDGEAAIDYSGWSVSLSSDGSTVAIGARYNDGNGASSGHVRIYKNISGTWTKQGSDIDGEAAGDESGYSVSLSSDGSTVAIGAPYNDGNKPSSGHVRIYKNISGTWTKQGSDIDGEAAYDLSGCSVSLSSDGSTVAIGAYGNNGNGADAGHVRIYKNTSGTWTQVGSDIDGEFGGDQSGYSVSLSSDGNTVAIGAPYNDGNGSNSGHVRIYKNINGTWTKQGSDINGEFGGDQSGYSVSLSSDGNTVAIGADVNGSSSGHVRIYKNISGTWTKQGSDIDGEAAYNRSGQSVSLSSDGNTVAIGAPYNDGNGSNSGHVRIYIISSIYPQTSSTDTINSCGPYTWTNGITYTSSNSTATDTFVNALGCDSIVTLNLNINGIWTQKGSDIDGEAADDESGYSVSLSSDGSTMAIGAISNNGNGPNSGQVRIYKNINGTWTQQGSDIDGEDWGDYSGRSVSLSSDGSTVAIGAMDSDNNNKSNSGHVRIYKNTSGTWTQVGSDIDGEARDDRSGRSVSLSSDGSTVAIGAYGNDGNGSNSGHVRIYKNINGTWTQQGSDIDGEAAYDNSGFSVSLSSDGSTVAIGAPVNNGNWPDAGHVRIYKNTSGTWTQVGSDIDGEAENDQSGYSVSLSSDGNTVAIGAPYNDGNGSTSGHVRIYKNINGTWTQVGSDIDGEAADDQSGYSVSLSSDGSTVAIGAPSNHGDGPNQVINSTSGHVRVYKNISGTWTQVGPDIDGEAAYDNSGFSVSLSSDGSTVAIGAPYNDAPYNDDNGVNAGHVRIYYLFTTSVTSTDTIISCEDYTWTNGITYTSSNSTATDTFVNAVGCVSIVTLNLTINNPTTGTDVQTACNNYTWSNGVTYTESNNTAKDTFVNAVGCDSIVTLNLTVLNETRGSMTLTECDAYTSSTGKTWNESGTYLDTLSNREGCDSVITYDLTIINSDDIISQDPTDKNISPGNDVTFTVVSPFAPNATYQWQRDNGTGFQNLSNAGQYSGTSTDILTITNVSTSNANEVYRCIVTANSCTDTSSNAILTIDRVSVPKLFVSEDFSVYPNPSNGIISIESKSSLFGSSYRVYSIKGVELLSGSITSKITTLNIQDWAEGVYLIRVGNDAKQTCKIIKQ
jgi:Flp pilus assembly pilin Flp